VIAEGGKVEGEIVAEELKISGRVEGSIHANRVQLKSTAVVAGDIFHRSLAVEENAQFEEGSRRLKDTIDLIARSDEPQPPSDRVDRHQR
jgi:cytoskeletal protein CcmA (bactofilin family)